MRLILLLLATIVISSASSAQRIKVDVDKNGDTMYSTSDVRVYVKAGSKNAVAEYLKTSVYKNRNGTVLCFSIQSGRSNIFNISSSDLTTINFEDGSQLSLYPRGEYTSKGSVMAYGSYIFSFYPLTSAKISQLKSSKISSITVGSSLGKMQYDLKEKFSETIGDQLKKISE